MSLACYRRPGANLNAASMPRKCAWPVEHAETGRKLWERLHRLALNPPADPAWLHFWAEDLPTPELRQQWHAFLRATAPDRCNLFGYTVALHNRVNKQLGRPTFTLQQAMARWGGR
jgi:hypothetical protein